MINKIGVLTSGGDAPGMNAAIRAVTRAAIYNGLQVKGIYRGYKGLVTGEIKEFKSQNVSNIIQLGGTILKTARCKEFTTPEGRQLAYDNMKKEGIDVLLDDRKERPGVKFKDMELIGIPYRITVGRGIQEGKVEFRARTAAENREIALDEVIKLVKEELQK